MAIDFTPAIGVSRVRAEIDHPIVDGDGHLTEIVPVVADIVRDLAGDAMAQRFTRYIGTMFGDGSGYLPVRSPFWGFPGSTLDRLTAALPALMYERLDELGIDFAVLYPGIGLVVMVCPDDELRRVSARAINVYYHEIYGPYRDRMTPTALIPTFTPDEAVDGLDHAVGTLGLKCVVMTGVVPRRRDDGTMWIDTLGHDSDYDYDPVWARCQELGVVPAFHGNGYGWGSRTSSTNYVYNHLGSFAAAQEAVCRSLLMGGVPKRFPDLRFAFLEGGVTWAAQLQADLIGHYEKRNGEAILEHDPENLDVALADQLVEQYATGRLAACADSVRASARANPSSAVDRSTLDEFVESAIDGPDDIVRIFHEQLFFGCEADDPLNSLAFSSLNAGAASINAYIGSDIGHWDVSDMRDVVPEAWEQVEHGHMTRDDFRAFTFSNVVRMLTEVNPRFFDDTVIAATR